MHEEEVVNYSDLAEISGLEHFRLKSVGITVGSSTSHLMFSELVVRRSDSRVSGFKVTERKVIYRSPIMFTPYVAGVTVDAEKLHNFFMQVYRDAGFTPDAVDTGAVIITGYAARKENAEAIVNLFSRWAGKFVCATAGANLESILAAQGSGAVSRSKETGKTVMNIDIGGGTTKVAIVKDGTVIDTSSICVGSRVIALDKSGRVIRIEESASMAAKKLGIELKLGAPLSSAEQKAIVDTLVKSLFELLERKSLSSFTQKLIELSPIQYRGDVDIAMFSGGVAEYIYGHEKSDFADLGPYLGERIKQCALDSAFGIALQEPSERIRATVMGAAQYSLQVSGNTIFLSSETALPKRNLQVVKVRIEEKEPTAKGIEGTVQKALNRYDIDKFQSANPIALAIDLPQEAAPTSALIRSLSQGLSAVWNNTFKGDKSMVLIFNFDIAKLVGSVLAEDLGFSGDIVCVDGIEVGELDYVDIGTEIEYSRTVPVVVKNLVFLKSTAE
ncbi:MAG: ethanolamine ammonia-lyase reactivating factor EutA [Chloroflexi bacterium]|nr:ethanolamine ammonia-lyase reactivating factor EutA [Chloroflexota bacterium]